MSLFRLIALVISITAIISVANARLLRLPAVIGPMSAALVLSALLMLAEWLGIGPGASRFAAVVLQLDFSSVFLLLSGMAFGGEHYSPGDGATLLFREVGGGIAAGLVFGGLAFYLLEKSSDKATHILITLAVASGGYTAALLMHTSGPIAMVISGLIVGNFGLRKTMDRSERHQVDTFWRLTDDVLNAVLFVLIGIHVLLVPHWIGWPLAVTAVSLGPGGRLIGVLVSTAVFRPHRQAHDMVWWDLVALLTWGGLRGGVSVALALTLPDGATRDLLLEFAYIIVLFSILVQGLTMGRLFDKASLQKMSERARAL